MTSFKEVSEKISQLSSADDMRKYILSNANDRYDSASLFVCFAYLSEKTEDKEVLRKEAYLSFFNNDRSCFTTAWKCIDCLNSDKDSDIEIGLKVRVLKGGAYKIKEYYLENNNLNDIRGASILLTHIEENLIPGIIIDRFIPECIVYNGGGNVFAILPQDTEDDFAIMLEEKVTRLLITANIAYCLSSPADVSYILGSGYSKNMADIENALDERKKLKIYNKINSGTSEIPADFFIKSGQDDKLEISFNGVSVLPQASQKEFCDSCKKRFSKFSFDNNLFCPGCLVKRKTGKAAKQGIYIRELKKRQPNFKIQHINSIPDISKDLIAVVYADGNNMGGIIQNFTQITQMMEFSRKVKEVTRTEVYSALAENNIDRFEIVALGGDDVFVIVPAKKSFKFAISFSKKYKKYFDDYTRRMNIDDKSTMSVGIAAAKSSTPVKIMLEAAEEMLGQAKIYVRNQRPEKRDGSIAFTVLRSYGGDCENNTGNREVIAKSTMQPYSIHNAENIADWTDKNRSNAAKTRIRNIIDAFNNAECTQEAMLFFDYLSAKNSDGKASMPNIEGFNKKSGFYLRPDSDDCQYIWNDLLELEKLCN